MMGTFGHAQARATYDRIGRLQDTQAFYEDRATESLWRHGDFEQAQSIVEFGCGTGRHAAYLLASRLPADATYVGYDVSPKMVALASARLAQWPARASVTLTDGTPRLALPDASVDRVLSTFVLDLLSDDDVATFLAEARRVLRPTGRLCLASAAPGENALGRAVMGALAAVQRSCPALVGGCGPIDLTAHVRAPDWRVVHTETAAVAGITCRALVALPRAP